MSAVNASTGSGTCPEEAVAATDEKPVETIALAAPVAGGKAEILRVFDSLRRQVSNRLIGHGGAFVGYDVIRLGTLPEERGAELHCVARALTVSRSSHRVDYQAFVPPEFDDRRNGTSGPEVCVAHAVGVTVGRPCQEQAR